MLNKSKVNINPKFIDHPIFNELIIGTNFGFLSKRGYYETEEAKKQPKLMQEMGINWTTLNMNFCQDRYYSDKVYLDFEYSTGECELMEIVKRLHDCGIKVLFKPCLTLLDGAWMGLVRFPDTGALKQIQGVENDYWGKWFSSFIESVKYFSSLAEKCGMDAMIIGAEYLGTEGQNEYWEKAIAEARKRFSGPLSYEFTSDSRKEHNLTWFNKLDFLSYSYYPPACKANVEPLLHEFNATVRDNPDQSVSDMVKYLDSRKARIKSISERFNNLPIVFTEYGVRSAHGCVMQPYNYLWDTYYDGEEQANYMEASFQTYIELDNWMGLFWWKWDETQDRPHYKDPNGDKGFTIQGKPAEDVMRKWAKMNRK